MPARIETTEMDVQHAAHDPDPEFLLESPDEEILYSDSLQRTLQPFLVCSVPQSLGAVRLGVVEAHLAAR